MGASYAPERVMNGTFAEMWINDTYLGEGTELEAKISLEKKEVKQAGTLAKGYKIVGTDGKGKLKVRCGKGSIFILELQSEGGKRLKAIDCAHNYRAGQMFGA